MSTSLAKYKIWAIKLLDFSLITYILLFLISTTFYLAAFKINVANSVPLLTILTLGVFTWALRYRLEDIELESLRPLLVQWTVVTFFGIIFMLVVILVYPIS